MIDAVPVGGRQAGHLRAADFDERMGGQRGGDSGREAVAVDRQRAAGRHLVVVRGPHDQRAEPAHLGMQQTDGVVLTVVGAERIRADEFGERGGLVGRGRAHRAHLVQHDRDAALRDLPSGLAACQAAADDMNCRGSRFGHGATYGCGVGATMPAGQGRYAEPQKQSARSGRALCPGTSGRLSGSRYPRPRAECPSG